jgi:hypothetical protein
MAEPVPEHRRLSRLRTCERPIYNPFDTKRRKVNPNWPWKLETQNLIITAKPKALEELIDVAEKNYQELSVLHTKFVALLIVYANKNHTFATGFRVGPSIFATAAHNFLTDDKTGSTIEELHIVYDFMLPFARDSLDAIFEEVTFVPCTRIEYSEVTHSLRATADIDPKSGTKMWEDECDFAFVRASNDTSNDIVYPYAEEFGSKDFVGITSYHCPITQRYLNEIFGHEVVAADSMLHTFHGYNRKSYSPGHILDPISHENCIKHSLIPHSCSALPGSAGSMISVLKDVNYFCGIHVGGWKNENEEEYNYNLAVSVNHPVFVIEYALSVFPTLSTEQQEYARPFLSKHAELLNKHNVRW